MSETGRGARAWRFYVSDMIECCEKVGAYTTGLDREAFVSDGRTYDATLRNLEIIGEAATHVPKEVRAVHPEIPWRSLIATRNRLIHSYVTIDSDLVWSIVQDDVPTLLPTLRCLLKTTDEEHE